MFWLVYKQLEMQFDASGNLRPVVDEPIHVLSYDEKPGIQAIATTSDDLCPDKNHSTIRNDYEYKRLSTISLLTAIDLQTGEAIPLVREKHSSKEYMELLKILDSKYPKGDKIRIVLDNPGFILQMKPEDIWQPLLADSSLYLLQNTVYG